MDALKLQVTDTDGVIASAIVAFTNIAAQIVDAAGDKTASLALAADLKAQASALAAAIPA